MNRQSRKKIITAEGSNAPKSTIILVFSHQRPIVRGANFLVTMPNRSIDQLLELNNIITKTRFAVNHAGRSKSCSNKRDRLLFALLGRKKKRIFLHLNWTGGSCC